MQPLSYEIGEILIERNPTFSELPTFAIYEGFGDKCTYPSVIYMDSVTYVREQGISRHINTWSHFWRKVTSSEREAFYKRLDDLGYYITDKGELKMCMIQDLNILKKRLKEIVLDARIVKEEKEILILGIEAL